MTNLQTLVIRHNPLTRLQDGIFDHLQRLTVLCIEYSGLQEIGDEVFNDPAKHPDLLTISLKSNKLRSVDAWPWKQAIHKTKLEVSLSENLITETTNRLGLVINCENTVSNQTFFYDVSKNSIDHLTDSVMRYFPEKLDFACFMFKNNVKVNLDENQIICDCLEYKLINLLKKFRNVGTLDKVFCKAPQRLKMWKVTQVADEEFQCQLSKESCLPGCRCTQVPGNSSFIIDCSHVASAQLPSSLPSLHLPRRFSSSTKYQLRFQSMALESVEKRDYLTKSKILNLRNNKISSIDEEAWQFLSDVREVYLENNSLSQLAAFDLREDAGLQILSLFNNPWDCSCDKVWFKRWLRNVSNHVTLVSPNSMLCATPSWLAGRNIFTVDEHEFCSDPFVEQRNYLLLRVLLPIACLLLLALLLLLLLRRFKVQLNTYLALHPFDRDECSGEQMEFDVFISSSYLDREVAIWLVDLLEKRGYRVCYHEKDFIGGQSIALNICHAVWCSKRVLCVVTKAFLDSHFCMYEFEQALQRNIQLNKKRLVVLMDESLLNDPYQLPSDFHSFIASHTYISLHHNKDLIEQVLYSMPISKVHA